MMKYKIKIEKRGIEFSFAWLFAILVGAAILFIAIYTVIKVVGTGGEATSVKAGKEIEILLNPLETGFESAQSVLITMPVESRIYNRCSNESFFGRQIIKVSQKNFGEWTDTDIDIGFQNKYIFSENFVEGKDFFVFSKPFEFPFKVADLFYLTPAKKTYCFIDPPIEIKEEISDLQQENILTQNCPENSINICFGSRGANCAVVINENAGFVEKDGQIVYYGGIKPLMYSAIFADKEVYECQVQRLMKRTNSLISIYKEKNLVLAERGCFVEDLDLASFQSIINNINIQAQGSLSSAYDEASEINRQNNLNSRCKLW